MRFEFKENSISDGGRVAHTRTGLTDQYKNEQEAANALQEQFYNNPKVAHFEMRKLVNGQVIITNYMRGGIVMVQLKSVV